MKNVAPNSWKRVAIKSICFGIYDGLHATPEPSDDGAIYLGIRNISEDGKLDFSDIKYIAEEDFSKWIKRAQPLPGDIVFTYEATLNRYAIIPNGFRGCLGRRLAVIKHNPEKVNNRFLFYYFFSEDWRRTISMNLLSGSTVDRVPISRFPEFEISLPPLPVQNKIASILSAYDDLIENNTRRIKILEEMAQLLYREWFVNFCFPGHQDVPMVESELGLIPQGWEVKTLSKITSIITKGTTPTTLKRSFVEEGINFIKIESLSIDGEILEGKFAKIDEETHTLLKRSQLRTNDILFSIAGAIGRTTLIPSRVLPANTNQALAIIRPVETSLVSYLYQTVRSPQFLNFSLGRVVQTAQANVSLSVLSATPILLPTPRILDLSNQFLDPIIRKVDLLREKNQNLRKTRDLLLPKLISGEIDVESLDPTIETEVGELAA